MQEQAKNITLIPDNTVSDIQDAGCRPLPTLSPLSLQDIINLYENKYSAYREENRQMSESLIEKNKKIKKLENENKKLENEKKDVINKVKLLHQGKHTLKDFLEYNAKYRAEKKAKVKDWLDTVCKNGLPESWKLQKVNCYFLINDAKFKSEL